MKIRANGMWRHCFHGTYIAVIGLWFTDKACAEAARDVLGEEWQIRQVKNAAALVWSGADSDSVKELVESFRIMTGQRDDEPIDSIRRSVDYGPEFVIEVNVAGSVCESKL